MFFRTLLALLAITHFSVRTASAQNGCFCLHNPTEAYFLWGCTDETPKDGVTQLARCWDRSTQSKQTDSFEVGAGWQIVPAGNGSCDVCRPVPEMNIEAFRSQCEAIDIQTQCEALKVEKE